MNTDCLNDLVGFVDLFNEIREFKSDNVFNPWSDMDPIDIERELAPMIRRNRLLDHFACKPKFLLIGEAPGYQGCHFSGVPFTSEHLLLGGDGGLRIPRIVNTLRITSRAYPMREPSATIVWRQLRELGIENETVLWNAFAWHPHTPGELMSNRAPNQFELRDGAHVLNSVIKHFSGATLVAVGKTAEWTLKLLGFTPAAKVRHPSRGGANLFREQMKTLIHNHD
jgi:hypothetical protein